MGLSLLRRGPARGHSGLKKRTHLVATVIAVFALFAALAGTATAAKLITGKDIQNNSVTGKDIKKSSLAASDLSDKAKAELKGNAGPAGPAGPAVLPKAYFASLASEPLAANTVEVVLSKSVPAGTYLITAKMTLFQGAADNGDCSLIAGGQGVDAVSIVPTDPNSRTPMAFTAVAAASPAGPIQISCNVDALAGNAQDIRITAIPVGEVG